MKTLIIAICAAILSTAAFAGPAPTPPPDHTAQQIAAAQQNIANTEAKIADPHYSADKQAKLAQQLADEQAALASLTTP